ncbi:hypothetical protein M0R45_016032 [Rubus argutus]|uniref:Uncharacterized protein n=1 Tax=Rubus argutus TaxID=59490 RepID=A0AAW1XRF0_RUBAR
MSKLEREGKAYYEGWQESWKDCKFFQSIQEVESLILLLRDRLLLASPSNAYVVDVREHETQAQMLRPYDDGR